MNRWARAWSEVLRRTRLKLLRPVFVCVSTGLALTQQPTAPASPAAPPILVRIRTGYSSGLSGYYGETIIEPGAMRSIYHRPNREKLPLIGNPKCKLLMKDWKAMQSVADAKTLVAFDRSRPCRACIDLPDNYITLEFVDGTRKSTSYDRDSPAELKPLLQKIYELGVKCTAVRSRPTAK